MTRAGTADPLLAEPVRPFTLHFRDPAVERRFIETQALQSLPIVRIGLAAAAVLIVVFWFLHEIVTPPELRVVPQMTLVSVLVLLSEGAFFAATFTQLMMRHHQASMAALASVLTVGIVAVSIRLPPDILVSRGYLFLVIHTFSIYTLMMRFPAAVACAVGAALLYVAAARSTGLLDDIAVLRSVFWLAVANVWGALIGYQLDLRVRREFVAMSLLASERRRSEKLLLNILPAAVAEQLKSSREAIVEYAEDVTVLFADIVGFTLLSARKTPQELVGLLDRVFTEFDGLADAHGLEKIKTIGDAYMAVAGLPQACADHAARAARMAKDMLQAVRAIALDTGDPLQLRIGLNSGPVVAGVIGRRKFIYDMWGDTVNTASRMESHGTPGAIHCTRATADLLRDFTLEPRGTIEVKGKGAMETFTLVT